MPAATGSRIPPKWVHPALAVVCVAWFGLRLIAPVSGPAPRLVQTLETVRVVASPESGRFELLEWPAVLETLSLQDVAEVHAAGDRLDATAEDANDVLAALARVVTARIERVPGGPVGLRLGGTLVVFPSPDAERLVALSDADTDRSVETLSSLMQLLDARLEEPPPLDDLDETVRRHELLRLHRDVRDAIDDSRSIIEAAVVEFRHEATAAAQGAAGPFLRRGRGIAIETLAAALLGVLLREAVRRRRGRVAAVVSVSAAPAAALATVNALSGSVWLPVHPSHGLSLAFVPLAFVVGWLTPGTLAVLSRMDRLFSDQDELQAAPPQAPARPLASPTAVQPPRPERAGSPVPRHPESAPFFRRRR